MQYDTLRAEREGRLGMITLDRSAALNALNEQLVTELEDVMRTWTADGGMHV